MSKAAILGQGCDPHQRRDLHRHQPVGAGDRGADDACLSDDAAARHRRHRGDRAVRRCGSSRRTGGRRAGLRRRLHHLQLPALRHHRPRRSGFRTRRSAGGAGGALAGRADRGRRRRGACSTCAAVCGRRPVVHGRRAACQRGDVGLYPHQAHCRALLAHQLRHFGLRSGAWRGRDRADVAGRAQRHQHPALLPARPRARLGRGGRLPGRPSPASSWPCCSALPSC